MQPVIDVRGAQRRTQLEASERGEQHASNRRRR